MNEEKTWKVPSKISSLFKQSEFEDKQGYSISFSCPDTSVTFEGSLHDKKTKTYAKSSSAERVVII